MPDVFVSKAKKKKTAGSSKKPKQPKVTGHKNLSAKEKLNLPGHTQNPLAAYRYCPDGVDFVASDDQERIVLLLRKHPITNLRWISIAILMAVAPIILSLFPIFPFVPFEYQIVIVMTWYLILSAYVFEEFLSWFFNVYIVTDERVFDVDFVNLIYREITDANIDQIQDVTVKVGGVLRTVVDYGDILIQTASENPQIEFEAVPHPDQVAQVIRELRVEEEQEKIEGRVR